MTAYVSQPTRAFCSLLTACFVALGGAHAATEGSGQKPLDVPFVPTPQHVVDRMLELAQVGSNDFVIDLGSGDGRIPITAATRYGARAMGVDLNPERIAEANENAKNANVNGKVEFRNQDLFQTPISDATVLTMYLLPSVNMKLRPRILSELQPGTRVVSHAFNMGDWEPDRQEKVDGRTLYLWIVPARVAGKWQVTGKQGFEMQLEQEFQKITGFALVDGKRLAIDDGRVEGDRIRFSLDGTTYTGQVHDNRITGEGWSAQKI